MVDEQPVRHVAAGGWRRAVAGVLVGLVAGCVVALVLPRKEGPRRRPPDASAVDRPATPAG